MILAHVTVILTYCRGGKKDENDADFWGSLLAHLGDGQQALIHVGFKEGTNS